MRRSIWVVASLVFALAVGATPVLAAPPTNDDPSGATVVADPLPYSNPTNVTEATTGADDQPQCDGHPADTNTVWYTYTASADQRLVARASGLDDNSLYVIEGSPAGSLLGCQSHGSQVVFDAADGTTYYFEIGATFGAVGDGTVTFSLDVAPPPLEVDIRIDPTGSVNNKTGVASISGTVTCNQDAFAFVYGDLRQNIGRVFTVRGWFGTEMSCSTEPTDWSATITPESGKFAAGKATASANIEAYNGIEGAFDTASGSIRLGR
ncbi:MAG TPA: hypothetical protein VJZ72_10865 [Candidatus Limnocylindrales bacterium]|nr:hypothetical protein [Candidatus Limnocylindrales bacterium]